MKKAFLVLALVVSSAAHAAPLCELTTYEQLKTYATSDLEVLVAEFDRKARTARQATAEEMKKCTVQTNHIRRLISNRKQLE